MGVYQFWYKLLARPLRALYRIKITGLENLPHNGKGYILCSNHTSLSDVFVIEASLDRQVKFMAKKELFKIPVLKNVISALGAFPVDRGGSDVQSIKKTIALLENGDTVGIFPQGTRHQGEDPKNTEVKHGVGLIACRAKCGVIPVLIRTKKWQVKMFRKTEFIIRKPIEYSELGFTDGGMKEYNAAAEKIFAAICGEGETND